MAPSRFKPRYDKWLWPLFTGVVALPLARAAFLIEGGQSELAPIMFVAAGFALLGFWFVLPRTFELWPDHLRIVLGWPWRMRIPMDTIAGVGSTRGFASLGYWKARFLTSFKAKARVEIRRTNGSSIVISPNHPKEFIEGVRRAMASAPVSNVEP